MSKCRREQADQARRQAPRARPPDGRRPARRPGRPSQTRPVPEERQLSEARQPGESELVLDLTSAAEQLGIPLGRLEEAVAAGKVASVPVGEWGCRMIPDAELLRLKQLMAERQGSQLHGRS